VASKRSGSTEKYQLIDALNAEWAYLVDNRSASVHRWSDRHRALRRCRDLTEVLKAVSADPDEAIFALLSEVVDGADELAGRALLQSMLGKIVRMVACDPRASSDDYVAAMWCRIRTYPLATRPVRIAANLALDTLKTVRRETAGSCRGAGCVPMPPDGTFDRICSHASAAQTLNHNRVAGLTGKHLIKAAAELGLIDAGTQAVLQSVYIEGMSSRQAADRHCISAANVRFRCSRAVRRLAQHSEALADVA
jgi:DNA-directed RNA polymerase specialized sigma24 family protein